MSDIDVEKVAAAIDEADTYWWANWQSVDDLPRVAFVARAAIAAYETAKAEDRAAHVAGLSSVINAVHGEALQELAIETVDEAAAKTIKSHPILDAIKASVPNISEWTITSGAPGTLFFDTHGGIITQAEKQSIRDAILGQLPSIPPVNVFFKDDI